MPANRASSTRDPIKARARSIQRESIVDGFDHPLEADGLAVVPGVTLHCAIGASGRVGGLVATGRVRPGGMLQEVRCVQL